MLNRRRTCVRGITALNYRVATLPCIRDYNETMNKAGKPYR